MKIILKCDKFLNKNNSHSQPPLDTIFRQKSNLFVENGSHQEPCQTENRAKRSVTLYKRSDPLPASRVLPTLKLLHHGDL